MCGICGFYGYRDDKLLKRMSESIIHRGPDEHGYYSDSDVSLANRRLSIIDLKTGRQPIYNEDKSLVVVYNGEIYNFRELRAALKIKGHKFKTNSDTEVIVHSFEEYGVESFAKFNGMFVFALWDKKNKKLFLVRDRLGIKPLYYYKSRNKIMFSSEVKSFFCSRNFTKKVNHEALVEYLTFQNYLGDDTLFQGVKMLPPGSWLEISKNSLKIKKYWDINSVPLRRPKAELITSFKDVLLKSVKRHMISDVPIGTYMSGGFDSTTVSAIASRFSSHINSFTGHFNDSQYDETPLATLVSKKIKSRMHNVTITPKDFERDVIKVIYHLEYPLLAFPAFSQFEVAKEASKHLKVVLTGHGGDELFAGYPVFKYALFREFLKSPSKWLKIPFMIKKSELLRFSYFLFFPLINPEVKHGLFVIFPKSQHKKMFTTEFYNKICRYDLDSRIEAVVQGERNHYNKLVKLYLKTYLHGLLVVEDKMSMAHSVEGRTPLLDNEMLDFALSVPLDQKLTNNELKFIIKEAMKGVLPPELYASSKKGFPTPLSKWFKHELKQYLYDTLLSESALIKAYVRQDFIRKLLDSHSKSRKEGLRDLVNANRIWSLLSLELWLRINKIKD